MIYAYKIQNDAGNYQTADGARFMVYTAASLHGAVRDCWQEFESLAAALEKWGLEPLPSSEEISYSRGLENDENDLTTTE